MSTNFFCLRLYRRLGILFLTAVLLFFFMYSCVILHSQSVCFDGEFYFLVTEDERVAAGAEFSKLEGGAGYLLEYDGDCFVAINVFMDRNSAEIVQGRAVEVKTSQGAVVGVKLEDGREYPAESV